MYLPPNYDESKSFPVIYMHDAQNVFEGIPSAYGKWNAFHSLNRLYHQTGWSYVVVAIEHGNELRHSEYSPWPHKTRGGGEGKAYMEFVVKTLKPLVDSRFKTLPTAKDTCIMGSSMGGLISTYAALEYGDVFGKVGAFSPAYWWCEEIYEFAANQPFNNVQKLVLLAGGKENEWYLPDTLAMYNTLVDNNYFEYKIMLDFFEWGGHEEAFWAMEFDNALDFLFEDEIGLPFNRGTYIVNFDKNNFQITIEEAFERFELLNPYGKIILKRMGGEPTTIPLKKHWRGNYIYKCYLDSGKILTRKISL